MEQKKTPTRGQVAAQEVSALLRARNPVIQVVTKEEARAERLLMDACAKAGYIPYTWDCAQGVCNMAGKPQEQIVNGDTDIDATLAAIRDQAVNYKNLTSPERRVFIMRDLPVWLAPPVGTKTSRMLRNLARLLPGVPDPNAAQAIIILTPSGEVLPELADHTVVVEWPLPDRKEIASILDTTLESNKKGIEAPTNGSYEAAIDAAVGLTESEAEACYSKSLVLKKKIDPAIVASEKKKVITRERVLEWFDPLEGGLDSVGGLDNVKAWLKSRAAAYTPKAREYGLRAPHGLFLVGISGCGKSMIAKAIATYFGVPLLRLDLNALKSEFVGKSEAQLRKALKVIEALGRCVVWIDEIEKAMQGTTSGSADGGVSADQLGAFLSWMQERQGEAFVVATANDISNLPPELLRKGRFDEIFFVDLPNATEAGEILQSALASNGRKDHKIDVSEVVARGCDGFTGAEIAAIVPDALFDAFSDGEREPTTTDLIAAASRIVPLKDTAADKIDALRRWAKGKARPATSAAKAEVTEMARPARRVVEA